MTSKWFETHAHLSDSKFDDDRDDVVARAIESDVQTIIEIADGPDEWEKARVLSESHPNNIWWTAGIHPYYAEEGTTENLDILKKLCEYPRMVAVGEVGLDYFKCQVSKDIQIKTFEETIQLAVEKNKPLVIHCRDAYEDLHPILKNQFKQNPNLSPGVIHCFSGNAADAKAVLDLGFYIGVDGPITYPSAAPLREAIEAVPIEKIVLETDSPYLPPQKHRGKRNEPSYIPILAEKLSELKGISKEKICSILHTNSMSLYRLNHA